MSTYTCVSSGGTNVESGTLSSTGAVYFKPDDTKFLKAATSNVALKAHVCMDCGCIALVGDAAKVKSLTE